MKNTPMTNKLKTLFTAFIFSVLLSGCGMQSIPTALNEVEAKYVVDTLLEEAENDDEYSLEEVQQKLSESFAKWGKD